MMIKISFAAALAAVAIGTAAAPQIASACAVTKTHSVKRVVHRTVHRPVAVAAYREEAPSVRTRTIVETRYIREPTRVVVAPAPVYYGDDAPYRVYYHHYGYYERPYYHHVYYEGPYGYRHW